MLNVVHGVRMVAVKEKIDLTVTLVERGVNRVRVLSIHVHTTFPMTFMVFAENGVMVPLSIITKNVDATMKSVLESVLGSHVHSTSKKIDFSMSHMFRGVNTIAFVDPGAY